MMDSGGECVRDHKILIRKMATSDLDPVIQIEELSYAHPWTLDQFLAELEHETVSRCYVALKIENGGCLTGSAPVAGSTVVGFIMAWLVADELHINNLAVAPEARRRGVAAALLEHTLQEARQRGAGWCQLEVRASNTPARDLYGRYGFMPLGKRKGYYQDGEDAVVMGKDLKTKTQT